MVCQCFHVRQQANKLIFCFFVTAQLITLSVYAYRDEYRTFRQDGCRLDSGDLLVSIEIVVFRFTCLNMIELLALFFIYVFF